MKINKKTFSKKIIFILIIVIFISVKIEFVKNIFFLITQNLPERINKVYGFCSEEGIGYLFYLKEKYKIRNNPIIINYAHVPQNYWAIINTKNIKEISDEIIFLNFPGKNIKINLTKKNNTFEFKDAEFYSDKFNSIKYLQIRSKENLKNNIIIEVYTISKSLNKKTLKKINFNNSKNIDMKLNFEDIDLAEKKLFFKFYNLKKKIDISLILDNKYDLNSFKVIDSFENCHYVK